MIDRDNWQYYGTKDLQVVPYMPGTPVYRDGVMSTLYYETLKEGKIPWVFCGDEMNHDQFVSFFEKRKTMQVLCRVEDDKTLKPRGYSWLDNARGVDGARAAMCGFCFFGDASEDSAARDLGILGCAYWMIAMRVDVIHGVMLLNNIPARNYARKLGFVEVAKVPRYHYYGEELLDARVMMLEKELFLPQFEEWRKENPVAGE